MIRSIHICLAGLLAAATAGCATTQTGATPSALAEAGDPTRQAVPLPSQSDWEARLILDNDGTGVWTVASFQVFEQYGCPEVVGLDDLGRCLVCVSYSGKWTPLETIRDGKWLGGLAHGDVDPRIPGRELYTGGQKGNLYQVVAHRQSALDNRLIAHLPGKEIHTIVAGDLDPTSAGSELIVFTRPGGLYRISPTGPHGTFDVVQLQELPGRVRDALVLPAEPGMPETIATVTRAGRLELLSLGESGPTWTTVYENAMGMGRIARRPAGMGENLVLYSTHDDGRILRHERDGGGAWETETIYLGDQGPRGIVAGRFDADALVETVAIFGYSGRVQLLRRDADGWQVETLFTDRDKGHWLAAAEVDGRNATEEIIASGFGARIVLLSRPAGYGRSELTPEP